MSDISGAFDRVCTAFLLAELRALAHPDSILDFLAAFLAPRTAHVVVGGTRSNDFTIENSVFQGTVLGPILWNCFIMDVIFAARSRGGREALFADDLSIFQTFDRHECDVHIASEMQQTRRCVHEWGARNRVAFESSKEHIVTVHPIFHGEDVFVFLGVTFDTNLSMSSDVKELFRRCKPKIKSILRARRYYSLRDTINLFKTHI